MKKFFCCCFVVSVFVFVSVNNIHAIEDVFSPKIYSEIKLKASKLDIDSEILINICEEACDMSESKKELTTPFYRCVKDTAIHLWLTDLSETDSTKIKTPENLPEIKLSLSKHIDTVSQSIFSEFHTFLRKECRLLMSEKWDSANKKSLDLARAMSTQETEFINLCYLQPIPPTEEIVVQFFEWFTEEYLLEEYLLDANALKSILSKRVEDFLISYYFMQRYPKTRSTIVVKEPTYEEVEDLIDRSCELFSSEKVILTLPKAPVLVIGDLHGNNLSSAKSIRIARNELSSGNVNAVVFLGDYIDRGFHSFEVIEHLLKFKLDWPEKVFLLRGNHENDLAEPNTFIAELNKRFGLKDGPALCSLFYDKLFQLLPIAAQVPLDDGKSVFCVHAGFPDPFNVEEMELFSRFKDLTTEEVFSTGEFKTIIMSMLWNDPLRNGNPKACRGNFLFSKEQLATFLSMVDCVSLVRGHEFVTTGYLKEFDDRCYTIFSSTNYYKNNCGIIVRISSDGVKPFARILQRDIEMMDMAKKV